MKIRYETLLPFYLWMWKRWRAKRWERFRRMIAPHVEDTVLDVGGNFSDWNGRKNLVSQVDLLNLTKSEIPPLENSPLMRSFAGDGRHLPFPDRSYDIVYSNSVIEHVGEWKDQQRFAEEALRVGKRLWVQTPAKECPVEPHFLGLFLHWFPRRWHVPLARWTSVVGLTGAADLHSIASTTRLLTKKEFVKLFPSCEIWTERFLFIFPKSYIAILNPAE